jgi:hypothetical protein
MLFEMIVGVLTTCHTQYTWDWDYMYFFYLTEQHSKFLLHTLQALYMCTVCNSTNINTIIEFVPNLLQHVSQSIAAVYAGLKILWRVGGNGNFLIRRCNYIFLCQVYCVWQVVKTPTIISNNPVYSSSLQIISLNHNSAVTERRFPLSNFSGL